MASVFVTSGTGENQQITAASDNKIRIFSSLAQLKQNLAAMREGEICATIEDDYSEDVFADIETRLDNLEKDVDELKEDRDKTYVFKVADSPSDAYFCADKPQGYAHILFIADQNTQMINIIWDVSNAGLNYIGPETGDAITAGLDDNVYGGASCHVKVNKRGTYFITTKDCILEHIETR